eukprot:GHVH01016450.1.p1 GENE.GHVH01016450.1~~GHVH01016450.1.p1  ORF type:complete len:756 (-),score=120.41 GHVH01016450.1:148-2415(-)
MVDAYDRFASPKTKRSDEHLDGALEVEERENGSRTCLAIIASVLGAILLMVLMHTLMVENVIRTSPSRVDLSGSVENFDSLEKMEKIHLGLMKDIQQRINDRFGEENVEPQAVDGSEEGGVDNLVGYLEEVQKKLDLLKSNQRSVSFSPVDQVIPPASSFKQDATYFDDMVKEKLKYEYLSEQKLWPYVGNQKYYSQVDKDTAAYYNSLAVFPYADEDRMHGIVGLNPDGSRWWQAVAEPPALKKNSTEEKEAMKRGGGFYLELSDHISLDRVALDSRPQVCKSQTLPVAGLPDASVIITFFNEPLSTLLRTIHSVLNTVPPPLLREIIIVDDHSTLADNAPGGPLYDVLDLLPKTKILRLPHRHGLVQARLAGIKVAQGEAVVILDSHVEACKGWMEPMLTRLKESPKSLVFPQIPAIDATDFSFQTSRGIGCKLSFKWVMQEQSTAVTNASSVDPVPSASMAGGLFAVYRDFFWYMGGYDEGMTMWGAENVEMPFRYWMCGAKVECTPCSRVYHIYRNKGTGYKSPSNSVVVNRLRTAYLWADQFYPLAHQVINNAQEIDIGPIDKMLEFKEKMQCKSFDWFLDFMELDKGPKHLSDVDLIGEIRNKGDPGICLDSLSNKNTADPFGVYGCHGEGGTQAWMSLGDRKIRPSSHENICCMWETLTMQPCTLTKGIAYLWTFDYSTQTLRDHAGTQCLTFEPKGSGQRISMKPCIEGELTADNKYQRWDFHRFDEDSLSYTAPRHSDQWLKEHSL